MNKIASILFWFSGTVLAAALVWLSCHGPTGNNPWIFIPVYCLSLVAMAGVWHWWPFTHPNTLLYVLIAGVAARALFLPYPESDDVYRYLWEGRIQNHGGNPYTDPPDDPRLADLRPAYWPLINHPDMATAYGPAAELLFRTVALVSETPIACKLVFVLFDFAAALMLFYLLLLIRAPGRNIILYALNPLVLICVAGEGHLESLALFFVVAGLLAREKRAFTLMYALLGMAAAIKLPYAIVVLFCLSRKNLRTSWTFLVPLCLYGFFASDPGRLLHGFLRFGLAFHYNGLVYSLCSLFLMHRHSVAAATAIFALALFLIFFLTPNFFRACLFACSAFLVCATTVHPWYLLMFLPFAVLCPSLPLITWCATVGFTFVTMEGYRTGNVWAQYGWITAAEYVPVVAAACYAWYSQRRIGIRLHQAPKSVSIVIPVLNEKEYILDCLGSVQAQTRKPEEIIVIDGGSDDGTPDLLRNEQGIVVNSAPRGRGTQIAEGFRRSSGDIIMVLHADSILKPTAIESMMQCLANQPGAGGGAFGARFAGQKAGFRIVDALNNFRARFLGISFGDQVQFVRRAALTSGFPDFRIMEDVELSLRIRESAAHHFIGKGVVSSARRWRRHGYFANFFTVIRLTALFILLRRFGLITDGCSRFYQVYYGKRAEA